MQANSTCCQGLHVHGRTQSPPTRAVPGEAHSKHAVGLLLVRAARQQLLRAAPQLRVIEGLQATAGQRIRQRDVDILSQTAGGVVYACRQCSAVQAGSQAGSRSTGGVSWCSSLHACYKLSRAPKIHGEPSTLTQVLISSDARQLLRHPDAATHPAPSASAPSCPAVQAAAT
jgi:hypothetical protein